MTQKRDDIRNIAIIAHVIMAKQLLLMQCLSKAVFSGQMKRLLNA